MFTTPVFIRKNTPELRQKLEKLGYKLCECTKMCDDSWLFTIECGRVHVIPKIGRGDFMNEVASGKDDIIYCGENENLFIAFAALRDDSDYMQYFTNGHDFILCDYEHWIYKYSILCAGRDGEYCKKILEYRKATKEEIIEHFKQ